MEECWTRWRSFGTVGLDDDLGAPLGLGVYEIRRASDHASVKLSFTANVAQELSTFRARKKGQRFFFWIRARHVNGALEYRFWSVSTRSKARATLRQVKQQRAAWGSLQVMWMTAPEIRSAVIGDCFPLRVFAKIRRSFRLL